MITTLLDLLGALLIILGLCWLAATYVPIWGVLIIAGLLVSLLSYIVGRRKGGAA